MPKLTIIISGKKHSGKSSLAKYIFTEYINKKVGKTKFILDKIKDEVYVVDVLNNNQVIPLDYPNPQSTNLFNTYSVKIYSFSDPLKDFCINSLGLDPIQLYGNEDDKNSITHISWDNIFDEIRIKHSRTRNSKSGKISVKPASGFMTANEVVVVVGDSLLNKIDCDWAGRSLYNIIARENYDLSIITDAINPNQVTLGTERGGKAIRLCGNPKKELCDEFDTLPYGEYNLIIPETKSMAETHKIAKGHIHTWFKQI